MRSHHTPNTTCVRCGTAFYVFPSRLDRTSYCSETCHDQYTSFAESFWRHVRKTETCWLWTGTIAGNGYGRLERHGRTCSAHRVAYELVNGPIPEGMILCHTCDVRCCVRPDHLFPGTYTDNMQDASRKGRMASGDRHWSHLHPERVSSGDRNGARIHIERMSRGEDNGNASLTWVNVREIRRLHVEESVSQRELARRFKVARTSIRGIVTGKAWRD